MEIKSSNLIVGDVILVKGKFLAFPLNLITRFFTSGFRHSFLYYGKSERGEGLVLENIARCGPTISPLSKYLGEEIEVYRLGHPRAEEFCEAVLAAGEEILKRKYAFFDWPLLLWKAIAGKLGLSWRIKSRYYPFYFCSEFVQLCFENAVKFLDENLSVLYKKEVLTHFPSRFMFPSDFRKIAILKKIGGGKLI